MRTLFKLQTKNDNRRNAAARAHEELKTTKALFAEHTHELTKLKSELHEQEHQLVEQNQRVVEADAQLNELKRKMAKSDSTIREQEIELTQLREKNADLGEKVIDALANAKASDNDSKRLWEDLRTFVTDEAPEIALTETTPRGTIVSETINLFKKLRDTFEKQSQQSAFKVSQLTDKASKHELLKSNHSKLKSAYTDLERKLAASQKKLSEVKVELRTAVDKLEKGTKTTVPSRSNHPPKKSIAKMPKLSGTVSKVELARWIETQRKFGNEKVQCPECNQILGINIAFNHYVNRQCN